MLWKIQMDMVVFRQPLWTLGGLNLAISRPEMNGGQASQASQTKGRIVEFNPRPGPGQLWYMYDIDQFMT